MATTNKPMHSKPKSKYRTAGLVILVLLVITVALFLFKSCSGNKAEDPTTSDTGLIYDGNAIEGGWDEADTDEIIASLNDKVEQGMINISMNTAPVFATGASSGNLMIVNESINNYPQVVQITRNDTNELIYTSGGIAVGSKIEEAKLDIDLPAGTYECTAMFNNVDPETGAYLGCAGAIITITVLD